MADEARKNSKTSSIMTPTDTMSARISRPPSLLDSISQKEAAFSPFSMEIEEYRPSIADRTRVGFFSQDRATQTSLSEVIQIKDMTEVLQKLVKDVENLKRSLHYAKHVLQADYENKLQERALDLYCRVNDRILDLEKLHEERINVVRRSYRQQLSDSIGQIAKQHEVFYAKKHEQEQSKFKDKLKKAKDSEETKNQAQQQQNTVIEMMKMQMREAQARADAQLKEALDRAQSPSSVATDPEIYELRDELEKLENKLEDQALELEDKENENRRLVSDVNDLNEQLDQERKRINQLKKELSDALVVAEQERMQAKAAVDSDGAGSSSDVFKRRTMIDLLLERQRIELQNQMEARIQATRNDMAAAQQKHLEDVKRRHDEQMKQQSDIEKKRLAASLAAQEKPEISESDKDELLKKLQKLEKKQRADIARLQRELDRTNKTWEMKVTILQQTLHALKDESFLRASLQRQAARLQYAAVVYATDGPVVLPTQKSAPTTLKPALPRIKTKRDVIYQRPEERDADSPFSEDRSTPRPFQDQRERAEADSGETEETEDSLRDLDRSARNSRLSQRPVGTPSGHVEGASPIKTVQVES